MTITRTTAKAAAFGGSVLLALSLAACGSNNEGETATPTTEAATTEEPASEEATTDEETAEEASTDEETTDKATTDAAGSGDEPSRDELVAGLDSILGQQGLGRDYLKDQGLNDEQVDQYFGCIVDEMSDDLSPAGKRALADGDTEAQIGPGDKDALLSSAETCVDKLTGRG